MMTERVIPTPEPSFETAAYFEAANRGVLLVRRCEACGEAHHYPRTICPFCFSDKTVWTESSGRGVVYAFSVLRRGAPVPYCIAYVTLAEGPTVLTNIVDVAFDHVKIGMDVRVAFRASEGGQMVPVFVGA